MVTLRSILRRGVSRSVTRAITPNSPYPPIASVNSSRFCDRLHVTRVPVHVYQIEGFDVANQRTEAKPAAVNVRRQGAADRQSVRSGLFLNDAPLRGLSRARPEQMVHQPGPVNTCFHHDQAALRIKFEHAAETRRVDQDGAGAELLPAHRVTASRDADPQTGRRRTPHDVLQRAHGLDRNHATNPGRIQLRVQIVHGAGTVGQWRPSLGRRGRHV